MIGAVLKSAQLVPGPAWAALGGAIALGLGVWWHQHHAAAVMARAVEEAILAERKAWMDAQNLAQIKHDTEVAKTELVAKVNMETLRRESQNRIQALEAGNARLAARADSLRRTAEDWRAAVDRAASESPSCGPIADAARAAGEVFGECGAGYEALGKEAGRLAAKVMDLQSYITRVVGPLCVAGAEDGANEKAGAEAPALEKPD